MRQERRICSSLLFYLAGPTSEPLMGGETDFETDQKEKQVVP